MLKGCAVAPHETSDQDIQWTDRRVGAGAHPDQPRPEITEMDYGMRDGVLRMKLRAATAGYIPQMECRTVPDHSLRGHEYRFVAEGSSGHLRREKCPCWRRATAPLINNGEAESD